MSAAVDIYIPTQWNASVSSVLAAAGFQVTARERDRANGVSGCEYSCTINGETVTLIESPLPDDSLYSYVLGLSRSKHSEALASACEALMQHGALNSASYHQRSHNA